MRRAIVRDHILTPSLSIIVDVCYIMIRHSCLHMMRSSRWASAKDLQQTYCNQDAVSCTEGEQRYESLVLQSRPKKHNSRVGKLAGINPYIHVLLRCKSFACRPLNWGIFCGLLFAVNIALGLIQLRSGHTLQHPCFKFHVQSQSLTMSNSPTAHAFHLQAQRERRGYAFDRHHKRHALRDQQ